MAAIGSRVSPLFGVTDQEILGALDELPKDSRSEFSEATLEALSKEDGVESSSQLYNFALKSRPDSETLQAGTIADRVKTVARKRIPLKCDETYSSLEDDSPAEISLPKKRSYKERQTKSFWTKEMDKFLLEKSKESSSINPRTNTVRWAKIATIIENQFGKPVQAKSCRDRFTRQLNPELDKSPITDANIDTIKSLLKSQNYFNKNKERAIIGIRYTDLSKEVKRPDHMLRYVIFVRGTKDPYLLDIRQEILKNNL